LILFSSDERNNIYNCLIIRFKAPNKSFFYINTRKKRNKQPRPYLKLK
jgi:hypothetical protein